jgi:hypothetical protein
MAFLGGLLKTVGITPERVVGLATQTASSGIPQAIGQVWKGSGQTFYGSAGQALGGALAGSAINIALNSLQGTNVVGPQGLPLNSGANILASTITPFITGATAAGINQSIQQALKSAGPFGPLLSNLGTGLINQAFNGLAGNILGNTSLARDYKMFPGAKTGGEAPADYGNRAYTLDDVVFSLQPANQGPQAFGSAAATNTPFSATKIPVDQYLKSDFNIKNFNYASDALKNISMLNGVKKTQTAFAPTGVLPDSKLIFSAL